MARTGRPSKYKPEFVEQAYKLCLLGAKDAEIANFFGVHVDRIYEWQKKYPEFADALKRGKADADAVIAQSLYHRAKGYSHPEDQIMQYKGQPIVVPTIKHYPPDTVACIFWLKNRQRDKWRDKIEQAINADLNITVAPAPKPDAIPGGDE
jgi:hypothetical protein